MYFSASYYPLALSLRKSFQYIPCSVVSTLLKTLRQRARPFPKAWPALRTRPFAGDQSYIHRRALPGQQPAALCPSKFSLVRPKQQNKTKQNKQTKPTHERKEEERKEKVLDHL